MPFLLLYLIKLSISLGVVWLFYQLLLRRLTFYNWNRWYLLGYSMLSFFIPLINIGSFFKEESLRGAEMIRFLSLLGADEARVDPSAVSRQAALLLVWNITEGVLVTGALLLLIRLIARWSSLRRVRSKARLIQDAGVAIYQVDQPILPFSFGNAIYINRHSHTEREWEDIILHEYVHIRQRHTIDILAGELLCIVNWYNPFAWLIRYSIRQNLEFIADNKVLEQGLDKKSYQYHLLKVIGVPAYRLANNFNISSLKKRIVMMNSIKSTRLHLVKFLFIFPLVAVLLVAFRGQQARTDKIITLSETAVLPSGNLFAGKDRNPAIAGRSFTNSDASIAASGKRVSLLSAIPLQGGELQGGVRDTMPARKGFVLQLDTAKKGEGLSEPLYTVDGLLTSTEDLKKINPSDIQSINIIKDEAAIKAYGEKGRNGVVEIRTKGPVQVTDKNDSSQTRYMITGKIDSTPVHFMIVSDSPDSGHAISGVVFSNKESQAKIKSELETTHLRLHGPNQPLIIMDGKEISEEEMKKLDPKTIGSLTVLKGNEAVLKYGDKGKNGVIIVALKKSGD